MVHKVLEAFEGHVREAYPCIAGAVGEGPASEFAGFVEVMRELPDENLIINGRPSEFPSKPDVLYATVGSLVNILASVCNLLFEWRNKAVLLCLFPQVYGYYRN